MIEPLAAALRAGARALNPRTRNAVLMAASVATLAALAAALMFSGVHTGATPSVPGGGIGNIDQTDSRHLFSPTAEQWDTLRIEPVATMLFRSEQATEGKIAINEDRATPIFSPYAGRVTRLVAKPGDTVEAGQALFFIEASDMVQAQNDFMAAAATLGKARSRVTLTTIVEQQNRRLFEGKAGSLRDFQIAEAELAQARGDQRSAEAALEAARNRLRILGKTDAEIDAFKELGRISPETPIYAPLGGTVVQRKVGPGQYVSYTSTGSLDPVFTIGDLSTVWVVAYVREAEAPNMRVGQELEFKVLAYPDQVFRATVSYVAAALDSGTRRLMVRAVVDNPQGRFKPEMFASVVIFSTAGREKIAVPRDAVIFEAGRARVWIAREDRSLEQRQITTGAAGNRMIEVLDGLAPGEKIVTKGSIFVDRAASG
ncbi:MAG: efflux RND transporter periplasmic adaptor subunit [Proteobacteria bacterium]|nr:efflux RND transporter periplasmic adaptor subunit [Pseudomonadota bacterium]